MPTAPTPRSSTPRRIAGLLAVLMLLGPARLPAQEARTAKPAPKSKTRASANARAGSSKDAKTTAKGEEASKAEESRPPSLFGDTSRFTRLGGWGSMGGTMGQWGLGRSVLVMMPAVQQELKLTEIQKVKVRDWLDEMRKKGEDMGKAMREQAGDPTGQEDVPIATRIFQFSQMMNQVGDLIRENENGLAEILTSPQRKRLSQIALQMEGITAVIRPEIAESLNVGPDQVELIQQVLAQSRLTQMTTWIERGMAMRRRFPDARRDRPAPKDEPKRAAAESKPTEPRTADASKDADPRRDPARAEQAKAMRKEFESMRERTDQIQDRTTREILRILTKGQRARFEKMLGEPFDPAAITPPTRSGPGAPARS